MVVIFDYISNTYSVKGRIPSGIICQWDESCQELTVARDKIGIQVLYYAQLPTSIIIASTIRDILPHIAYPSINMLNLAQPIRYNFPIDLEQTWINQIKRLRAGELLKINNQGCRRETYWKRDYTPIYGGSKKDAHVEALNLLRHSIEKCLNTATTPVAVLLSGGLDSTSLAIIMKELQGEVHAFSAGYKGNRFSQMDERSTARRFAMEKNIIFHEVELDFHDFQTYLDDVVPNLDEPCFDVNCMVQYALYKEVAKMGYKTILSGLGGDELFYGYALHNREAEAIRLRHAFNQLYPVRKHMGEYIHFIISNYKHVLLPNHPARIDESMLCDWTYNDYKLFAKSATINGDQFANIDVHVSFPEDFSIIKMYDFLASTFAINMCIYNARTLSLANGVEVRFPFLDTDFVQFMDSLPLNMKFDIKKPKCFQKEMMADILPHYILNAPKRGFEPPFEFIHQLCAQYQYKRIKSDYVFFNSMLADRMIDYLLFR